MVRGLFRVVVGLSAFGSLGISRTTNFADWGPYPPVAPYSRHSLPHQWCAVNMYFPLVGSCHYKNDYDAGRGAYRHTGIDIDADQMTPIVAPFSGTIGMKRETFWIYGDNGWAMLGTHLNDNNPGRHDHHGDRDVMFAPNLHPGQHINGGDFIGYVGDSGNATGPHLHFELYKPGTGPIAGRIRNPLPSLRRAQRLHSVRVTIPDPSKTPDKDDLRLQACVRLTYPEAHKALFILLAKQNPKGLVEPVSHPRYIKLHLSDQAVEDAGGWEALSHLGQTKTVALYTKNVDRLDGNTIHHLMICDD